MASVFLASLYANKKAHWHRGLASEVYDDGTFELVPIHFERRWGEPHQNDKTYSEIPCWHDPKQSLAQFLRYDDKRRGAVTHDDPDFHSEFAYGERQDAQNRKAGALFGAKHGGRGKGAQVGDWVLVVANMAFAKKPGKPEPNHPRTGWHLVSCLKVERLDYAGKGKGHSQAVSWHQHARDCERLNYASEDEHVSLILAGNKTRRDQRFSHAIPLLNRESTMSLLRDKKKQPVDPTLPKPSGKHYATVMECVASFTRTVRCIGETNIEADRGYLKRLNDAILVKNESLRDLLWCA